MCVTQDIEAAVDAWRYRHRVQEAVQHSEQVAHDFPVQMNRSYRSRPASTAGPTSAALPLPPPSVSALNRGKDAGPGSRAEFLHMLQKLNGDEYGERAKSERAGLLLLREEDHMQALKKQNRDIGRRLSRILHQQKDRPAGKTDKRVQVADFKKKFGREVRLLMQLEGNAAADENDVGRVFMCTASPVAIRQSVRQ